MLEHSVINDGLHLASIEALICLKAKTYLEIAKRIINGSNENAKQLRKHKGDVLRLAVMLTGNHVFKLPESLKVHLQIFVEVIAKKLPDIALFKEIGLNSISVEEVLKQLIKSFELNFEDK